MIIMPRLYCCRNGNSHQLPAVQQLSISALLVWFPPAKSEAAGGNVSVCVFVPAEGDAQVGGKKSTRSQVGSITGLNTKH